MTDLPPKRPRRAPGLLRPLAPIALAALTALGACAPLEGVRLPELGLGGLGGDGPAPRTERLAAPLGPIRQPPSPLSASFAARDLLTGQTLRFERRPTSGGVRVRQSDGCVWTRPDDWFAPSDSWANCGDSTDWQTAQARVRRIASIWPLAPGAEGRWTRKATSKTGRTSTRETVCRVTGSEAVIRESGRRTPAHVVVCTDGRRTRTTWFAPGDGPVAYRQLHESRGVEAAWVRL